MMRLEGWPEPNMTSVLIRGTGKQRHAQRKAKMDVMRGGGMPRGNQWDNAQAKERLG